MDIDPKETVDREVQRELFIELLQFKTPARLLRVKDNEGTGKTQLLRRLEYYCKYESDKPVSYLPLENFGSRSDFELIAKIRDDLKSLEFSQFDELRGAYLKQDATSFSGKVDAAGATVSGGIVAGIYAEKYIAGGAWSPGMDKYAEGECIKRFLRELKQVCATEEVVLLIDSWDNERTSSERREWLVDTLIKPYCLDPEQRPKRLVAIVAGRHVRDFKTLWGGKYADSVRESPFEVWNREHLSDFLKVHGFRDLTPDDIDYVWSKMKNIGISLNDAISMAVTIQQVSKRRAS